MVSTSTIGAWAIGTKRGTGWPPKRSPRICVMERPLPGKRATGERAQRVVPPAQGDVAGELVQSTAAGRCWPDLRQATGIYRNLTVDPSQAPRFPVPDTEAWCGAVAVAAFARVVPAATRARSRRVHSRDTGVADEPSRSRKISTQSGASTRELAGRPPCDFAAAGGKPCELTAISRDRPHG